jgi:hypothetical protein
MENFSCGFHEVGGSSNSYVALQSDGGKGRNRATDIAIFKRVFRQLNYLSRNREAGR